MSYFDIHDWIRADELRAWRARAELHRRADRDLTADRRDALICLLTFHGPDGLYPSDATVAARAGLSSRTVRRARRDARELGMLTWERTRKRGADGRWRQGSNRYLVIMPTTPVCPGGQGVRERRKDNKKRGLGGAMRQHLPSMRAAIEPQMTLEGARAALADRAKKVEAVQRANWAARRPG